MALLVLGMGGAAFMADRDARNRAFLEPAVERTAVGDRAFFPVDEKRALLFEAAPLVLAAEPESRQESSMLLAGTIEGLPYRVYAPRERMEASGEANGATWWLKTGPGQFLKASR